MTKGWNVKLVFRTMIETMRTVRDGSESTARTVRMCVLFVVFVGGGIAAVAWLLRFLGL